MGRIFCVMGKSASGKDSIFKELMHDKSLKLKNIVPYTTRPIRDGEQDGKDYIFCTEADVQRLESENKIIELREYNTVYGIWKYFTVDDGQIDLDKNSYILIGTLETYVKICRYFGNEKVIPIYIEVEDGVRLQRALDRERCQKHPKYEEMCRRFLADAADFSKEKLQEAGIHRIFYNEDLERTEEDIVCFMREVMMSEEG